MILAAIDIGSNAARLLINEVKESSGKKTEYTKLNLLRIPLRLGMDVFSKGEIGNEKEEMFIKSMKIFGDLMKIYKVESYRACATSAMRDAKNGQQIIERIKKESGIKVEIITGDEEASIIFENHIAEGMDSGNAYLYIDVGGGSTELTFYENEKLKFKHSFNIGTIRILENLVKEDQWKEMKVIIKANIQSKKSLVAIGSGGNINKLYSLSKMKDGKPLSTSYIKKFYKEASDLTVSERMEKYKIREDRADVLVPALLIYARVLSWAGIAQIYVPKISVADGLIHQLYNGIKAKK